MSALPRLREMMGVLAVLAFLLRSFVPVGYMPDMRASGGHRLVSMTICTGMGPAVVQVPAFDLPADTGGQHQKTPSSGHQVPCPFSSVFAQGIFVQVAVVPIVAARDSLQDRVFAYLAPPSRFDVYLAQGPPAAA